MRNLDAITNPEDLITKAYADALVIGGGGGPTTYFSNSTPASPAVGDYWFNTTTGVVQKYVGSSGATAYSLWGGAAQTGVGSDIIVGGTDLTVATRFTASVNGNITGISVLEAGNNTVNIGLYTVGSPGTLLTSRSFTATSRASGWTTFPFTTPQAITGGSSYYAALWRPGSTTYSYKTGVFTAAVISGPLTAPADNGTTIRNGAFAYGGGALGYPSSPASAQHSYYVDVQFDDGSDWETVGQVVVGSGGGTTEVFVQTGNPGSGQAALWIDTDETAPAGPGWWSGSQSAYDGISTKDPNTMYIII